MPENIEIFDALGNPVSGVLSIPQRANSVVIMSHGLSSSKDNRLYRELEAELNGKDIGTLRYDYYGHGPAYGFPGPSYGMLGDVTLSKTMESLKAMIYLVRQRGEYRVGLLGSSYGGLLSIEAASRDKEIAALALKSPVTEPKIFWKQRILEKFGERGFAQWKKEGSIHYKNRVEDFDLSWDFWYDLQKYDTLADAKKIRCPVLIVHGDSDSYVPIEQSYLLSRALGKTLREKVKIVRGADHGYNEPEQYSEMKNLIRDFLFAVLANTEI